MLHAKCEVYDVHVVAYVSLRGGSISGGLDFCRSLVSSLPSPRRHAFRGGVQAHFPNSGW